MRGFVDIAIHTNIGLRHQVEWAESLKAGFARHGLTAEITPCREREADLHVVQGPWFAFTQWERHPRVLFLDRCFYGDTNYYASIGKLLPDGTRDFNNENSPGDRWRGSLGEWKTGTQNALVLADYNRPPVAVHGPFRAARIRRHPAQEKASQSLADALEWADIAAGETSTALIDAVLAGVPIVCSDKHIAAPVAGTFEAPFRGDRTQWAHDLAYCQWNHDEIKQGEAWGHISSLFA